MYACTALFVPNTVLNFQNIDFYFQKQNVISNISTFWLDNVYVWANFNILSCQILNVNFINLRLWHKRRLLSIYSSLFVKRQLTEKERITKQEMSQCKY